MPRFTPIPGRIPFALLTAAALLVACGGEASVEPGTTLNSEGAKTGDGTKPTTTTTSTGAVAKVTVSPKAVTIKRGLTETLKAVSIDASNNTVTGHKTTWVSRKPDIATVSDGGQVTGKAVGAVWVVASIEQVSDSANVTITTADVATADTAKTPVTTTPVAGPVAKVIVSPTSLTLKRGATETVKAVALDAAGIAATGHRTTWTSRNAAVATVSDGGQVTAVTVGSVWVVAAIEDFKDSVHVTVVSADAGTTSGTTTGTTTTTATISTFSPTFTVLGVLASNDTTKTEPVGGVVITVTCAGDGWATAVSATPPVTTEASGHVTMKGLPLGTCTITATPPAGSPYQTTKIVISRPTTGDPKITIILPRRP